MSASPHLLRLLPVLDYIEQQYNSSIQAKELEAISFYSYRNLQRIFKALFGETIGAYQQRLRLENAAKLMHYSNKSLSTIALEVGYADLQAFRKAFKKKYGLAPSLQRPILIELLHSIQHKKNYTALDTSGLNAQSVSLAPIPVVFQTYRGAYEHHALEKLWEQFYDSCLRLSIPIVQQYGLVFDDIDITQPSFCRYDACLAVPANFSNDSMPCKKIGGQHYWRFNHQGAYEQIEQTYDAIFGTWLLENPCNFSTGPIIEHYYYNADHSKHAEDFKTHIYIPI